MSRPELALNTLVQSVPVPRLRSCTASTRTTFGHQRERWYGSETTSQTSDRLAPITRVRLALVISAGAPPASEQGSQIPHQQQMLQMRDHRREALERLDRL